MHDEDASHPNSSCFEVALKVVLAVMKNKVVMSTKHLVGIIFMGATGEGTDMFQESNVFPFLPLDVSVCRV